MLSIWIGTAGLEIIGITAVMHPLPRPPTHRWDTNMTHLYDILNYFRVADIGGT